ncbi:MAG TPA: peroxidase-related enzyme [Candidatus Acidoferrales bacterium]|nr:peroxidase-related enzyme [Candidatus Acidoferrales bacterium]
MTYVNEIEEAQANPRLRGIYGNIEQNMGFLPHYFKAIGAMPDAIEGQLKLGGAVMNDGALTKTEKEQIGVVVSGINSSSYCLVIHMELLQRLGVEKSLARKLVNDYENAAVPERMKALFRFAEKLTRKPVEIEEEDIRTLKTAGWDDAAVRETVLTVSYFNYVNRVSLGLGLVEDF